MSLQSGRRRSGIRLPFMRVRRSIPPPRSRDPVSSRRRTPPPMCRPAGAAEQMRTATLSCDLSEERTMPDGEPAQLSDEARVLLTVIYDSGVDERVMALIAEHGVEGWTKLQGAQGYGGAGYKLDTPVWPGINHVLLLAVTPEKAGELAAAIRALQNTYRRKPGITLWTQPVSLL